MRNTYFHEFMRYTLFNVLGMIGLSCYILADTFFVSKSLGTNGLTALNLAIPIYSFIHGTGLMLGMGGATKYAVYKAQKNEKEANRVFMNTLSIFLGAAFLFVTTGLFCPEKLTVLLGADKEVFAMTNTYLKTLLLFSPAFLLNDILICFVRNDGMPRLAMLAMLGGSFSNVILDFVFLFPLRMGIFGAVLATGLAPVISIILLSSSFLQKKNGFHLQRTKFHIQTAGSVISLGFPSMVAELSSGIVMIVFNMLLLKLLGNIGVAAYGIVANLSLVVTAVYTGIAQGIQPIVSEAYGHGDMGRGKQTLRYAVTSALLISCAVYGAVTAFGAQITDLFNSERNMQLKQIAVYGLRLYFTAAPFVGFNLVISMFFTSLEKPVPAHLISLLRGLVLILPAAFLLSNLAGITGVWLSFPVTEGLVTGIGIMLYLKYTKK